MMRRYVCFAALAFAAAQLACAMSGAAAPTATLAAIPSSPTEAASAGQPTQTPVSTVAAQPAQELTATPGPTEVYNGLAGAGDPLDLCTFPTPEEVAAVIGGPAIRTIWFAPGQNCTLSLDVQNTRYLIVQAGHDSDGKLLHLGGLDAVRGRITDQAALQLLDQLHAQVDTLTLPELVEQALPVWRAAGFSAEEAPGLAPWAFWFYGTQGPGTLGEVGVGRASGAWVAVYTNAPDEETARALLPPLAVSLLDRLPDNFTPTGTTTP